MKYERMLKFVTLDLDACVRIIDLKSGENLWTDAEGMIYKTQLYERKVDSISIGKNGEMIIYLK